MTPARNQRATCGITPSSPAAPTPCSPARTAPELGHQASRGYPRAVNRLAAAALLATYTTRKTIADTTAVRAAITEVNDQ